MSRRINVCDRTHYRLSKMGAIARSKIQEQIKKANNIPNRDATKIKVIGWFSRMKSDRHPAIAQSKELVPHTTKVASITPNTIQSICWGTSVNTTADKDAVSSHRLIPEATKDRSTISFTFLDKCGRKKETNKTLSIDRQVSRLQSFSTVFSYF